MMASPGVRIFAAIPAAPMLGNGVGFLLSPEQAAASLGMPLLDGLGRSTQIGDFGAFFLGITIFVLVGAYRSTSHWLYAGAIMLGLAAVIRTWAWVMHGADLATVFIGVEVVLAGWLVTAGLLMDRARQD
ncbi:MAG: hypothetical protein ACFHX7_07625 [Pseudomonadota bacterium]